VVGSLPGQPYSDSNVGSDRANILALYYNEGYPEATLRPVVEDVEPQKMKGRHKTTAAKGGKKRRHNLKK